jgi:hypothetical protein
MKPIKSEKGSGISLKVLAAEVDSITREDFQDRDVKKAVFSVMRCRK